MLYFSTRQRRYILFRGVSIASRWVAYFPSQGAGHQLRVASVPREFLEKVETRTKQAKVLVCLNLSALAQVSRVSTPSVKVTRTWDRLHVSHTWYRCAFPDSVLVWRIMRSPNDSI